jgi:transposase InsO family protein
VYDIRRAHLDDRTAHGISVPSQGVVRGVLHPQLSATTKPPTPAKTYFFSFAIDCFSRKIIDWQLASRMRSTLVLDALRMALGTREHGADAELVHHSDAGSQYASFDHTQTLKDHGVLGSSGTVGDATTTPSRRASSTAPRHRADRRPRLAHPTPARTRRG